MELKKKSKKRAAKKHKAPVFQGWRTSDQDEIERRRYRGMNEKFTIEADNSFHPYFGNYRVQSESGVCYEVATVLITTLIYWELANISRR